MCVGLPEGLLESLVGLDDGFDDELGVVLDSELEEDGDSELEGLEDSELESGLDEPEEPEELSPS
ncbi:hypothetical protein GGI16_007055 [Coemansia sp. S142-1]|nr:hypothetical protein GGI16_007055 [Coemansia sp. S142-1]